MSNRKKIENKCKDLGLKIDHLCYIRQYEDSMLSGYWQLWLENGDYYETCGGFGVDLDVEYMLKEIEQDVKFKNK